MIDLTKVDQVRQLQTEVRTVFDNPSGREVMKFLDQICGWYDFTESDKDINQLLTGRRQVLATVKTLLEHSPEQVAAVARKAVQT
jgi:hypothetical protein